MKKYFLVMLVFLIFALGAVEPPELITKSYLDSMLTAKIVPIQEELTKVEGQFKDIKNRLAAIGYHSLKVEISINKKTAYINGQPQSLDVPPILKNDRTYVPVRFIGEAFGAQFSWDSKLQKVTYFLENNKIELYINNKEAVFNGQKVILDAPPLVVDGRTLVPFRFMGQSIGAEVQWDGASQRATIVK